MNNLKSYQLRDIRIALIEMLTSNLNKNSKWYSADYEAIVRGVNKKTRKELIETYNRQVAIMGASEEEIKMHCIV